MRLVTRSDFDGLACAVLLEDMGIVDDYLFAHPKDVQDGLVHVTNNDILANVPFVPGCGMWFDHHSSEKERLRISEEFNFEGASVQAPSCARVIYDYYGGAGKFQKFDDSGLMWAVDKSDSADFKAEEVLHPKGWVLLSFIMDARTGLGRYRDYRVSNIELMRDMITYCRTMGIDEILKVPDVVERVERYQKQEDAYQAMLKANSYSSGNVIVIDLRNVEEILSGNRFIEYSLYPEQNVSIRAIWGKGKKNIVFTVGHSIINRTCRTDVGSLMLKHGGGGHRAVGTCQVSVEEADRVFEVLIKQLEVNG